MDFTAISRDDYPVLLDGAMGTLLHERGYHLPAPDWSAAMLEAQPDVITGIHKEYIDAGAQIITTATFRTTSRVYSKLKKPGLAGELNRRAVQCAKEAIGDQDDLIIAGSVAPLEDCYRPDLVPDAKPILREEHREQIQWLVDTGVDLLLFETMNSVGEAVICSELAHEIGFPYFTSLVCSKPGVLLSGEPVEDVAGAIESLEPLGLLINCTAPEVLNKTLEMMKRFTDLPVGGYANLGYSEPEEGGNINEVMSPEDYVTEVKHWLSDDPIIVGGCCGSTPEHIQMLYNLLH